MTAALRSIGVYRWPTCIPALLGWLSLAIELTGCKPTVDPVTVIDTRVVAPPQATIASVEATGPDSARIIIKYTAGLKQGAWQLIAKTATGQTLSLVPTDNRQVGPFSLAAYRAVGLTGGQTYVIRLHSRYNNADTLTVERRYTHRLDEPTWTPLAHLPFTDGQFTGTPIALDPTRRGDVISVFRYIDDEKTDALVYNRSLNDWQPEKFSPPLPTSRPGIIQFLLYYYNADAYRYYGLGYRTNDLFPGKYVYLKDLYGQSPVQFFVTLPSFLNEMGEPAFYTIRDPFMDRAFFLTQNGSPAQFAITAIDSVEVRSPLPEKPGSLATFSVGSLGFVINETGSGQPHLWMYDAKADVWTRRADFPGAVRVRGVGFSAGGKGYYGLGTSPGADAGYRDLWQYDPQGDQWRYITDYPGQGHRYLIVLSTAAKAYLGWGYETQRVVSQSPYTRQVGCTDFWEFTP